MGRINVTELDEDTGRRRVAGWFEANKADGYNEDTEWDGNNNISKATGSQWDHEMLYRTQKGRWVRRCWSQRQSSTETFEFISDDHALEWLIAQNQDAAVEEHFGKLEEERGPGRPEVGGAVHLRLGDLLPKLDARAKEMGMSRPEAARHLLAQALG